MKKEKQKKSDKKSERPEQDNLNEQVNDIFKTADKIFIDFDNMISNFDESVKEIFKTKK